MNVIEYKKSTGQYFTVNEILQQRVFDFVKHKGQRLLEPSFGAGHLLQKFKAYDANYPMVCFELDETIKPVVIFNNHQLIFYGDFTQQTALPLFPTIIGNPPFVKQTAGNLYIQFIEQCYSLLADGGELIFIVPSDFMKMTRAASIITTMKQHGAFTDFYFPHDERLFNGASIDVVVFRYEKGATTRFAHVNEKRMYCQVTNGILTFSESESVGRPLSERFDIYVGLVSGKEKVYKVPIGNIQVLNDIGTLDKYIFTTEFPTLDAAINAHLLEAKPALLARKIRTFTELNWFEWGAPRNITTIRAHMGEPCIFIQTLSRRKDVAFIEKVQYFGGGLLCMIPRAPMTTAELHTIVTFLNSSDFQKDYIYSGRFKIGHKQLENVLLQ
jgi:adenine-specific DNA-methyltransferase